MNTFALVAGATAYLLSICLVYAGNRPGAVVKHLARHPRELLLPMVAPLLMVGLLLFLEAFWAGVACFAAAVFIILLDPPPPGYSFSAVPPPLVRLPDAQ